MPRPASAATTGKLVTLEAAAERLGVSTKTIRRLIWEKELAPVDVGAGSSVVYRIPERELDRFIARRTA